VFAIGRAPITKVLGELPTNSEFPTIRPARTVSHLIASHQRPVLDSVVVTIGRTVVESIFGPKEGWKEEQQDVGVFHVACE
jgi:hypothetical protein